MNLKLVFKVVGRILQIEAVAMVFPLAVALVYREDPAPFLWSIAAVAVGVTAAVALLKCKLSIPKTILLSAVLGLLLVR